MRLTPAEQLRALMQKHGLTRAATAELGSVAKVTVDSWLAPPEARLHRTMQRRDLDLIRFRLDAMKQQAK